MSISRLLNKNVIWLYNICVSSNEYDYESKFYINYKTKEAGFAVDTVVIIAKRIDADIYTRNQSLIREVCNFSDIKQDTITFYSTLLMELMKR